ncbi:hypothetical protein CFC21_055594 [Triticum aestivum]|uniref:CDC48 N-terminal subdomain domain-containing protein n=2 Tax=Triticum aestivum TaxID=4565 RepID=A0A9R1KA69_WHEAT|nr:hypothetical protein CFC21_055594 [Triticum aestivum]
MGERVCAGDLIRVYKGERRSEVRLLPRRGQIRLRIAHDTLRRFGAPPDYVAASCSGSQVNVSDSVHVRICCEPFPPLHIMVWAS